jgi:hypothetical protein
MPVQKTGIVTRVFWRSQMSWSFEVHSRSKGGLKAHCRKKFLCYHQEGTESYKLMLRVAEHVDAAIDFFEPKPGCSLFLKTHGHVDTAGGGTLNLHIESGGAEVID